MLDASRKHEHLPGRDMDRAIPEIDPQIAFQDDECLVGIFMVVPNEVALQLHDLELVVVHFGDDLRRPLLVK